MPPLVNIQNLNCGGCATTIELELSDLDNIADPMFDLEKSTVSFESENVNNTLAVKDRTSVEDYTTINDKNSVAAEAIAFDSCDTGKNYNK